jgi:hypothetical protein
MKGALKTVEMTVTLLTAVVTLPDPVTGDLSHFITLRLHSLLSWQMG